MKVGDASDHLRLLKIPGSKALGPQQPLVSGGSAQRTLMQWADGNSISSFAPGVPTFVSRMVFVIWFSCPGHFRTLWIPKSYKPHLDHLQLFSTQAYKPRLRTPALEWSESQCSLWAGESVFNVFGQVWFHSLMPYEFLCLAFPVCFFLSLF